MFGVKVMTTVSAPGVYLKSVLTARVESAPVAVGPAAELTRVVLKLRVTFEAAALLGNRWTVLRPRMRLVRRDSKIGRSGELKVAVSSMVSPGGIEEC
jgi:hypothetical protein